MFSTGLDALKANAQYRLVRYGSQFSCRRIFGATTLLTLAFTDSYERDLRVVALLVASLGPDYVNSPNVELHLSPGPLDGSNDMPVIGAASRIREAVDQLNEWYQVPQESLDISHTELLGDIACDALFSEYIYVNKEYPRLYERTCPSVVEMLRRNPVLSEFFSGWSGS